LNSFNIPLLEQKKDIFTNINLLSIPTSNITSTQNTSFKSYLEAVNNMESRNQYDNQYEPSDNLKYKKDPYMSRPAPYNNEIKSKDLYAYNHNNYNNRNNYNNSNDYNNRNDYDNINSDKVTKFLDYSDRFNSNTNSNNRNSESFTSNNMYGDTNYTTQSNKDMLSVNHENPIKDSSSKSNQALHLDENILNPSKVELTDSDLLNKNINQIMTENIIASNNPEKLDEDFLIASLVFKIHALLGEEASIDLDSLSLGNNDIDLSNRSMKDLLDIINNMPDAELDKLKNLINLNDINISTVDKANISEIKDLLLKSQSQKESVGVKDNQNQNQISSIEPVKIEEDIISKLLSNLPTSKKNELLSLLSILNDKNQSSKDLSELASMINKQDKSEDVKLNISIKDFNKTVENNIDFLKKLALEIKTNSGVGQQQSEDKYKLSSSNLNIKETEKINLIEEIKNILISKTDGINDTAILADGLDIDINDKKDVSNMVVSSNNKGDAPNIQDILSKLSDIDDTNLNELINQNDNKNLENQVKNSVSNLPVDEVKNTVISDLLASGLSEEEIVDILTNYQSNKSNTETTDSDVVSSKNISNFIIKSVDSEGLQSDLNFIEEDLDMFSGKSDNKDNIRIASTKSFLLTEDENNSISKAKNKILGLLGDEESENIDLPDEKIVQKAKTEDTNVSSNKKKDSLFVKISEKQEDLSKTYSNLKLQVDNMEKSNSSKNSLNQEEASNKLSAEKSNNSLLLTDVSKIVSSQINNSITKLDILSNSFNNQLTQISEKIVETPQPNSQQSRIQQVYDLQNTKDISRLVKSLEQSALKGESKITVHLYPEHLGKLEIKLAEIAGKMTAKFTTESEASHRIMLSQADSLRNQLAERGITVDNMEFSFNDPSSRQQTDQERRAALKQQQEQLEKKGNIEKDPFLERNNSINFRAKAKPGVYA